jgi:TolA-binding protein
MKSTLTQAQFFHLGTFLQSKGQAFKEAKTNPAEIARQASEACKFPVSDKVVKRVAVRLGIPLDTVPKPQSFVSKAFIRIQEQAYQIEQLQKQLSELAGRVTELESYVKN